MAIILENTEQLNTLNLKTSECGPPFSTVNIILTHTVRASSALNDQIFFFFLEGIQYPPLFKISAQDTKVTIKTINAC